MPLIKNNQYLIKKYSYGSTNRDDEIYLIDVLEVTRICYKIKFEYSDRLQWIEQKNFEGYDKSYSIIEDLGKNYKRVRNDAVDTILGDIPAIPIKDDLDFDIF